MSVPNARIEKRKRVTTITKLLRSKDRKVANAVTPNGKQASIANTFGLPAGKAYSCPGATSVCESVCYAGKLEKVFPTVKILKDIPNLSLYYSTDSENKEIGIGLKNDHSISLAYLAKNFEIGQADMKALTNRPGAKCPENKKAIPLISQKGSACATCKLCIYEKSDIVFSATKK